MINSHPIIFVVLSCLISVLRLHAATLHVKSDASGTGDGSSWTNAYPKLQDAIAAANSGDLIWVAAGIYYPDEGVGQTDNARTSSFTINKDISLYGGFNGTETVLLARDPFTNITVLSGDVDQNDGGKDSNGVLTDPDLISGDNCHHVVSVIGHTTDALISGFTLTGGLLEEDGNGGADESARGAGIYVSAANSLHLDLCNLQGNDALEGGGIFINRTPVTVANSSIQANKARLRGGGVYRTGSDPVSFYNCVIAGNYGVRGGGAFHEASATTSYINCTIHGNIAGIALGNGIYDDGATTSITNSILWNTFDSNDPLDEFNNNGTNTVTFSHSLLRHYDLTASGSNLDGTDPTNDPLFLSPLANNQSPQVWSNFAQSSNSPINDIGDNSANFYLLDVLFEFRVFNDVIDLGAVEYQSRIWYVNDDAPGANNGTSWGNAFTDLQDALASAMNGDEIWIAAGIYRPGDGTDRSATFRIDKGILVYGGFNGTESDREQRAPSANRVILSGDLDQNDTTNALGITTDPANLVGNNAYTVCRIFVPADVLNTEPVLLTGVTITGGLGGTSGGGLSVSSSTDTTVAVCSLRGNSSNAGGGLSFGEVNSAKLYVEDCIIRNNTAVLVGGGAVFTSNEPDPQHALAVVTRTSFVANNSDEDGGAIEHSGALHLIDSTFSDNEATDEGGAIYSTFNTSVLIEGCSFSSNTAVFGGALRLRDGTTVSGSSFDGNSSTEGGAILADTDWNVQNCTFTGNSMTGSGGGGGAIYCDQATITGSSFTSNTAAGTGGAIRLASGDSSITNSEFYGNESSSGSGGGGVYIVNGNLDLTNCAFGGNKASSGGGVHIYTSTSSHITNCSFQGNASSLGGAIQVFQSSVTLSNTVAWNNASNGNVQDASASIYAYPATEITYTHCLLDNLNPAGTGNQDGTLAANDPDFVTSTNPLSAPQTGGDLRIQSGSPAINQGLNSENSTTTDLAGNFRIFDTTIDLGAYEFGSSPPLTFAGLHPGLSPDGDENGNGLTNYTDYALGADPTLPLTPSDITRIEGSIMTLPSRSNASDVFVTWEKSTTLATGSWSDLVEGIDYTVLGTTDDGEQAVTTLQLLLFSPGTPRLFIRQSFATTP